MQVCRRDCEARKWRMGKKIKIKKDMKKSKPSGRIGSVLASLEIFV